MNTKDLTLLSVGVGIVILAYMMKKRGIEGFQMPTAAPSGAIPPPMPPVPAAMPPMPQPPMPQPTMPQPTMPQPPMMPQMTPPQAQPMPGAVPTMQLNQQQLMDVAAKVQRLASEQNAISGQLQQMTQSFAKEGFQSYQNPYNAGSPGDTQAMEFRLGKKAMVDNVVQYA